VFYAALKRRSSTVVEADGVAGEGLLVDADSRFLSGFAVRNDKISWGDGN
jgi:hypothetical protein